jgi:hypothetical protein
LRGKFNGLICHCRFSRNQEGLKRFGRSLLSKLPSQRFIHASA